MRQVSIDIETLGTAETAIILSIGAVAFNGAEILQPGFYTAVDIQNQFDLGRTCTGDTIKWWLQQSKSAQTAAFLSGHAPTLSDALQELTLWYGNKNDVPIWAKPSTFDISILQHAYQMCGLRPPWHYRSVRCLSTLMRTFPAIHPEARAGVEHNAYDDALEQALFIQKLLEQTGGKR